jgi:sec-independent protein translocase protein TatA
MSVELSVADVREALLRVAPSDAVGTGEPATLLLGRLFHEVFADLTSDNPKRSGLRVIVEAGEPAEQRLDKLLEHVWRLALRGGINTPAGTESPLTPRIDPICVWQTTTAGTPHPVRMGVFEMLNNIGPIGLIVILVVVLLLFGRGKIPQLMGDVAKGIKSFKRGMKEDLDEPDQIDKTSDEPIDVTPKKGEKT